MNSTSQHDHCSPFPTHRGRNKEHTPTTPTKGGEHTTMKLNTIGPILIATGSLATMWGGHADASSRDGSQDQGGGASVVAPAKCAHTVLTASENPENSRIVATPSDMKSAGIGGRQ